MKFLYYSLLLYAFSKTPVMATYLRQGGERLKIARQSNDKDSRRFRSTPLCVDEDNKVPGEAGLDRFTWIFEYYKKQNTYIPVWEGKTSPTGMITRFDVSAVKIEDANSGYNSVLKNWVHIDLESAVDIEGLYVQAIGVPWGTPFGEFITNFDCGDCVGNKTSFYEKTIKIIPCMKRPALEYTHPNVFTIGGSTVKFSAGEKRVFFSRMHFNFRYTQYPCVETTHAQFLVIAVRSFKGNYSRFETFYSPIYELDVQDNAIGAFYPFYNGWSENEIKCHAGEIGNDFKLYSGSNRKTKLRYNQNFDTCVLFDVLQNVYWYTCPPGPINMQDSYIPSSLQQWRNFRQSYSLEGNSVVDKKYGENALFCHDADTWDWNAGDLKWELPEYIEIIYANNESIPLNETVAQEMPSSNHSDCEELASQFVCSQNVAGNGPDCRDFHSTSCSVDAMKKKSIVPLYGRDKITGEYILRNILCSNLSFTDQINVMGIGWGHKFVLVSHGKLMVFAWTVAFNIVAFSARFMKEFTVIEKRSSYFGIGNWLWSHMIWTYVAISALFCGSYLMTLQHHSARKEIGTDDESDNVHDLCYFHTTKKESHACLSFQRKLHNIMGYVSIMFFAFSYISGWGRPVNRFLRILLIAYHCGMGYLGKFMFYVVILVGHYSSNAIIGMTTFWGIVITDLAALGMTIVATVVNCIIDGRLGIKGRQYCPVPEGIYTPEGMNKAMRMATGGMMILHILIQFIAFYIVLGSFHTETNLCKRLD